MLMALLLSVTLSRDVFIPAALHIVHVAYPADLVCSVYESVRTN